MDTTHSVARLSVIANSVNALKELQGVTYDYLQHDLEDFELYMRYVSEYLTGLDKQS